MSLWDRRLVVVSGKGGVGKTTVAIGLALAAARAGRRSAVVELDGASAVAEAWGLPGRSYAPQDLAEGAVAMSLSAPDCIEGFGRFHLRSRTLTRLVFHNRFMSAFLDAVPGMPDLMQLGRLNNLVTQPGPEDPRLDLLVVDAPATGHGLALLASARSMADMTGTGPFHDASEEVARLLEDPERTGHVLVTLPEELPVNETLELLDDLGSDRELLSAVVVNQALPDPLPEPPPWTSVRAALEARPDLAPALAVAQTARRRHARQAQVVDRLRAGLAARLSPAPPVLTLPKRHAALTRDDLIALAHHFVERP